MAKLSSSKPDASNSLLFASLFASLKLQVVCLTGAQSAGYSFLQQLIDEDEDEGLLTTDPHRLPPLYSRIDWSWRQILLSLFDGDEFCGPEVRKSASRMIENVLDELPGNDLMVNKWIFLFFVFPIPVLVETSLDSTLRDARFLELLYSEFSAALSSDRLDFMIKFAAHHDVMDVC